MTDFSMWTRVSWPTCGRNPEACGPDDAESERVCRSVFMRPLYMTNGYLPSVIKSKLLVHYVNYLNHFN